MYWFLRIWELTMFYNILCFCSHGFCESIRYIRAPQLTAMYSWKCYLYPEFNMLRCRHISLTRNSGLATSNRTITNAPNLFPIVLMFFDGVYPYPVYKFGIQGRVAWLVDGMCQITSIEPWFPLRYFTCRCVMYHRVDINCNHCSATIQDRQWHRILQQ